MKLVNSLFVVSVFFGMSVCLAEDKDVKLKADLIKMIEDFSEEKGLTISETRRLATDLLLGRELISLDGGDSGIISQTIFVDLKSNSNRLVFSDGRIWTGQKKDKVEVIALSEDRVFKSNIGNVAPSIILVFERDRVQVINMKGNTSGYYARSSDDPEK